MHTASPVDVRKRHIPDMLRLPHKVSPQQNYPLRLSERSGLQPGELHPDGRSSRLPFHIVCSGRPLFRNEGELFFLRHITTGAGVQQDIPDRSMGETHVQGENVARQPHAAMFCCEGSSG